MSINITPSRRELLNNWFLGIRLFKRRLNLSTIPSPAEADVLPHSIEDAALVDIINSRFDINPTSRISAVFGKPDFLPFSFLELGVRRGAAVCRLTRKFSEEARQEIVKQITELEDELKNSGNNILHRQEIEEIFSMSEKEPGFADDFFAGIDPTLPSDALRDPDRFRKLLPIPIGTGFLVGSSYLLTNNHVIPDIDVCKEVIAEFGYDQDGLGRKIPSVVYELDPEDFFETNGKENNNNSKENNESLDYSLVKLKGRPQDINLFILGRAGDHFGWITLDEKSTTIAPPIDDTKVAELQANGFQLKIPQGQSMEGEPVNIIQHPKGKRKQVILSSNRVTNIYEKFIQYKADADFSSSGSPVFNQQWQLVALHHAAVAKTKDDSTLEIEVEQGVRTCEIVKDLKKKKDDYQAGFAKDNPQKQGLDPRAKKIQNFIDTFVNTEEKDAETKYPVQAAL